MASYIAGAAAGIAARRWLDNRNARQQAEQQLELQANAVIPTSITARLPVASWFTAPGMFSVGLPAGFIDGDFKVPQGQPLLRVVDSIHPGTYMAIMGRHLNVEFDGHSVWVAMVNPDGFRQAVRSWGGNVVQGPVAVVVDGERGIWTVVDTFESGQHVRRWSLMTAHAGKPYEVILGAQSQDQEAAVDALATAVASWRWADSPVRPIEAGSNALQVNPIVPQLALETWFDSPGEFRFGLPRNFAVPAPEIRTAWEKRNGPSLVSVEEPRASDYAMFLMVQRDDAIAAGPLWALADNPTAFRERAWQLSKMRVSRGPEPILVGGEQAIRFDVSQGDDGVDTRHCVAEVAHAGRGYVITMYVKTEAQARYESVLLTCLGSWHWL